MEFIDLDYYKSYQGTKRPEVEANIPHLIPAANSLVTSLLGLNISANQVDLLPTKPSRRMYFLTDPTASQITKMTIGTTEISPEQYKLYPDGKILLNFNPTEGYMDVEYEVGGLNPVPEDLKAAACMLVEYWNKKDYRSSRTFGGETIDYASNTAGVPEHIRAIIGVYRRL
ncbi:hypothetical protein P13BB106kb_p119 [Pectobacterium phage DU_PP_V]|uniref:Head completion protein n=1 Tax=Pectobacterium phage DU_PP_V TaxID=2041492 RepID=A0A2D2W799_9CAUD|nr:head-tail adaptor [Pectobacterium phage DU_PP_V]ATS94103.1 hypothetical protein P13BB106kb_p119 [Pectobacterium phage DU_PP_V]